MGEHRSPVTCERASWNLDTGNWILINDEGVNPMENNHSHTHSHEHTKEVSNRLARAIGHLQKVKSMVENGEDCSEVLVQLAAVKSAINNTGKVILKDHMEHCIVHAVEDGNMEMLDELTSAIDKFMK